MSHVHHTGMDHRQQQFASIPLTDSHRELLFDPNLLLLLSANILTLPLFFGQVCFSIVFPLDLSQVRKHLYPVQTRSR